jgi:hypothetical protein
MSWLNASVLILSATGFNALAPHEEESISDVLAKYSTPLELKGVQSNLEFSDDEMPELMIVGPDAPVELYSRFASMNEDPCLKTMSFGTEISKSEEKITVRRKIIMVASETCPPCNQFKSFQVPKLKAAGWNVGMEEGSDLQIVSPGTYSAAVWPTFIYIENGKEVRRHEGYATMSDITWLLSGSRNSSM